MANGEESRKDVLVRATPAIWPPSPKTLKLTPQDEIAYLRGELLRVEAECKQQIITAETLCQTAVCLIHALQLAMGAPHDVEVEINSELFNRMYNTRIHVRADGDGNLHCSYTDRTNDLFVVEGRTT